MQPNSPPSLMTAPKVSSSPASYYDGFYPSPPSTVPRPYPMDPMMAAAAAAAMDYPLPPLSHMLSSSDPRTTRSPSVDTVKTPRLRGGSMYMMPPYAQDMFSQPQPIRSHPLPSPPTSVIDGVLLGDGTFTTHGVPKVFSFVPLPGVQQKKRPRRKYHEVERLYKCHFQNCNKSYGTLNHLNAHVSMQKHGPKRQPSEFKELRKIWRKQKRENKIRQKSREDAKPMDYPSPHFIPQPHWVPPARPYSYYASPDFMPY
ncbi:hypothetical protein BY458DRAFT_583069 [Sporodiniella umbellata]|nr:hypothetical protein BY458DRAFT_583069 [Sporodiniella umbellata]